MLKLNQRYMPMRQDKKKMQMNNHMSMKRKKITIV